MAIDLSAFQGKYPPEVISAAQSILDSKPDQAAAFQNTYNGDFDSWIRDFEGFWSDPNNTKNLNGDLSAYGPEQALMTAIGYQVNPGAVPSNAGPVPLETALGQIAVPGLVKQVTDDAGRQQQVQTLTNQTNTAYGNLGNVLSGALAHFDGQAYFQANPDVAANYQQQPPGSTPGTRSVNGQDMTPDQFALYHYQNYGQSEGRQPTFTSTVLQQNQQNAATASGAITTAAKDQAAAQLAALQQSIASMQQNLTGNLAAKASALQQAVASLNSNLETLDASQKQALAQQISTMGSDLETSINSQKAALAQEVQQLQGNASEAAKARSAALQQELDGLTAAQAPLAQARLQGAEALTTAVNLGLESTKKDIAAQAAQGGFMGGSTMTDAALARAAIDARQQAAQAIAGAKTANAADSRDIGVKGATGQYSIADALAAEHQNATNLGATGGAALSSQLAQGKQSIGDYGAAGLAGITNSTAGARATIGNNAASQTYADTVGGADASRTLADTAAKGGYDISSALASQIFGAKSNEAAANFAAGQQLFPQSVNAAQTLTSLPANQAQNLASIIPLGNAGLSNTQQLLNWWSAPASPPNTTVTLQQPSQSGNQISQLGNGLLGAAFQLGNSQNWWQAKPSTNTTKPNFSGDYSGYNPSVLSPTE
jgi:hypothetical protein